MEELTKDEVLRIIQLVEQIETSGFQSAEVQVGQLRISLSKQGAAVAMPAVAATNAAVNREPVTPSGGGVVGAPAATSPDPKVAPGAELPPTGALPVRAPSVGRYYAQPEPGAAPYITLGQRVQADSTVGLIEVMKVYTSVEARVEGVVAQICVCNEEFVEHGQVLMYIVPDRAAGAS